MSFGLQQKNYLIDKHMSAPGTIKPLFIGKVIVYTMVGVLVLFVLVMLIMRVKPISTEEKESVSKYTSFEMDLVEQAQKVYEIKVKEGWDFTNGPCLSNNLAGAWVIDIAHSPRQAIDDLPENQCTAYLTGQASHFIELDLDGNLIRLK